MWLSLSSWCWFSGEDWIRNDWSDAKSCAFSVTLASFAVEVLCFLYVDLRFKVEACLFNLSLSLAFDLPLPLTNPFEDELDCSLNWTTAVLK